MAPVYRNGFDTHTHIDDDVFDADRSEVLERARKAGILGLSLAAGDPATWDQLLQVATTTGAVPCLGHHPWWVDKDTAVHEVLAALRRYDPAIVGEIGLDRLRGDVSVQHAAFVAQLDWAAENDRPVVLHAVRAVDEVLHEVGKRPGVAALLHGFIGSTQQVDRAASLGVFLSIGPAACTATGRLVDAIRRIPAELLCLETDAPHRPIPGEERGEPVHLIQVAECVAAIRQADPVALLAETGHTARTFFCPETRPNRRPHDRSRHRP